MENLLLRRCNLHFALRLRPAECSPSRCLSAWTGHSSHTQLPLVLVALRLDPTGFKGPFPWQWRLERSTVLRNPVNNQLSTFTHWSGRSSHTRLQTSSGGYHCQAFGKIRVEWMNVEAFNVKVNCFPEHQTSYHLKIHRTFYKVLNKNYFICEMAILLARI